MLAWALVFILVAVLAMPFAYWAVHPAVLGAAMGVTAFFGVLALITLVLWTLRRLRRAGRRELHPDAGEGRGDRALTRPKEGP